MNKEEITINSSTDNLTLYANVYTPDDPKFIVQIIHGMAEHKERYDELATLLTKMGAVVLVADNRGHGKSINEEIPLGYSAKENGWLINLQDLHQFSLMIQEKYRRLPFFLLGHSMGSLIAHSYLKRYEDSLAGVIFSGMPAYNKSVSAGKALCTTFAKFRGDKSVSKALVSLTDYNKSIKNPRTPFDWISYNTDNVNKYVADPLCGFSFTNRGYYDLMTGMQDAYEIKDWRVLKPDLPILFVVGNDDLCADVPEGFQFALDNLAKAGYNNIEANVYENMRHEIFNERERKIVYKDVLGWLLKHNNN
ncbi:MAG: alpha/beta fold hydrolase [Erysipelotrichaceae bacterium]|nr:alpha/beta fold hydrolase [Erysipelotrichaceae bacterium]